VFRASAGFAAWFNLATIRNEAFHETVSVFIIDFADVIVAKLTDFAA